MVRVGACQPGCGACCRWLRVVVHPGYGDPDRRRWLELHGLAVGCDGPWTTLRIPLACRELTADGRCGLHGTDQQPDVCQRFPTTPDDLRELPECSFRFEEGPDGN